MITLNELNQISETEWELPASFRQDMLAPVRIFATRRLLEGILEDRSLEQAVNTACLPGLAGPVLVMPDIHQGYGFPIGGVAAMLFPQGVVSPGGIGYDINCGVRLLAGRLTGEQAHSHLDSLANLINEHCPSGVGSKGILALTLPELDRLLVQGSGWALKHGYASPADIQRTEDQGCIPGADPARVSERAKSRGRDQIGSLGAGNHFMEADIIEEVFDEEAARVMGLRKGCLGMQIHCGSRGLGHQVCSDYVQSFQQAVRRYGIQIPDRELVCAPMDTPEGQAYLGAMRSAANYAFCNRQILAYVVRQAFEKALAGSGLDWQLHQVYDVGHNMGKIETHRIDGRTVKVCVHRKGATRAFGPGSPGLPSEYSRIGQPVLVPGSMGTASWVLCGNEASLSRSLGSSCHGAGRVMSRQQARHSLRGDELRRKLESTGIHVRAGSLPGLAEEAPQAYKDVDEVVETICAAGLARKVARLVPVLVIKG